MADGSMHGLFSSRGIVGFLYVIVLVDMCVITYAAEKVMCVV